MRAPAFWWKPTPDVVAHMLSPFGALYGAIASHRMGKAGARVGTPVICVGNFVAGGAGKTPTAIAIARELLRAGETPFFLSRGYGAQSAVAAPLVVDPSIHTSLDVGDEPLLLARAAPTIVSADRVAGAREAVAKGASVIVMDDGLQNPSLAKDTRIAVVDGGVGVGNGLCIPAGPLRAPLAAQFAMIDALVIIGEGEAGARIESIANQRKTPVIRARLAPDADASARLRGQRVLAFAGIGRPEKFFATLESVGAKVVGTRSFPDHHPFSVDELSELSRQADANDAILVTTEKDQARIGASFATEVLPVTLEPDDASLFAATIGPGIRGTPRA
jgi:tetraacyldisaccharide 4'-kinase